MKKISLFLSVLLFSVTAIADDGPYAVRVNGSAEYDFTLSGNKADDGREQLNVSVPMQANDYFELLNKSNGETWIPRLEAPSDEDPNKALDRFEVRDGKCYVNTDGCYNFWWKKAYENDDLYIGSNGTCDGNQGNNQGENQGNNEGDNQGQPAAGHSFYVMGWINGADAGETAYAEFNDALKFVDGKVTIDCKFGSYIGVKDEQRNYYYAEGASDATGSTVTLKWANGWSPCQKWAILEGTQYIIMRSVQFKGEIVLETVDKATYDAYKLDMGTTVDPIGENLTVKFQKPEDWSTVNIYAWGGSSFGDWPGSTMNEVGNGWYSAEITAGSNIIFNDGTKQTIDIENVTESTCYTLAEANADGKYLVNIVSDCQETAVEETQMLNFRVENGTIISNANLQIFNIMGQDVTYQNGNLDGMYIVRVGQKSVKVVIK